MIDTDRVVGFYTDIYGNEIDEYEQVERYSVYYKGCIFTDDSDQWNSFNTDNWDDAISFYNQYQSYADIYITDNEYSVTFMNGDWY